MIGQLRFLVIIAVTLVLAAQGCGSAADGPYADARRIEEDPAPNLPGEFVDLTKAFADGSILAHYANDNGPNANAHVTHDVDYSKEATANSSTGLPPAGGPHWGSTSCGVDPATAPAFCGPVQLGIYRAPWHAETLVHNMEHGGVIVWYNTADTSVRNEIEGWVTDKLDQNKLVVMMPYPDIPSGTIALTVWSRRDVFPVSELTKERVMGFIDKLACHFNPEHVPCG